MPNPFTSAFDALKNNLNDVTSASNKAATSMKYLKDMLDGMNKAAGGSPTGASSTANNNGGLTISTMNVSSVTTMTINSVQNLQGVGGGTGASNPAIPGSPQQVANGAPQPSPTNPSANPGQNPTPTKSQSKNSMAAVFGENWMLVQATERGIQFLGQTASANMEMQTGIYNQMLANPVMTEESIKAIHMRGYGQFAQSAGAGIGGMAGAVIGGLIGGLPTGGIGAGAGATLGGTIGSTIGGGIGSGINAGFQREANLLDVTGNRNLMNFRLEQGGVSALGKVNMPEQSTLMGSTYLSHLFNFRDMRSAIPIYGWYNAYATMTEDNEKYADRLANEEFKTRAGEYKLSAAASYKGGRHLFIPQTGDRAFNEERLKQQVGISDLIGSGLMPELIMSDMSPGEIQGMLRKNPSLIGGLAAAGVSPKALQGMGLLNTPEAQEAVRTASYQSATFGFESRQLAAQAGMGMSRLSEGFAAGAGFKEIYSLSGSAGVGLAKEASRLISRASELRRMPGAANESLAWEMENHASQLIAQIEQTKQQAVQFDISEHTSLQGEILSQSQSRLINRQYGFGSTNPVTASSMGNLMSGFGDMSQELLNTAAMKRRQAELPNQTPGARANLRREANELEIQAKMTTREAYGVEYGTGMATTAITSANVEGNIQIQGLMGNASQIESSMLGRNEVFNQQISAINTRISRGGLNSEELQNLNAQLAKVMNDMKVNAEQAAQAFAHVSISVAGYQTSITTAGVNTSLLRGAGGAGFVASEYGITRGIQNQISVVDDEIRKARARGVDENSPEMMQLREKRAGLDIGIAQNEIAIANTPLSANFRREQSRLNFESQFFSIMPMGYGNVMNIARGQMGIANREIEEIQRMRDETIRQQGKLEPSQELIFQERMQNASMKYAEAYNKLSFGWQDRLISTVINAPGSFSMVSNRAAYFHAVGAGVRNPFFGFSNGNEALETARGSMFTDPMNAMTNVGFTMGAISGNKDIRGNSSGILGKGGEPTRVVITLNTTPDLARLLEITVASKSGGATIEANNPSTLAEMSAIMGIIGGEPH